MKQKKKKPTTSAKKTPRKTTKKKPKKPTTITKPDSAPIAPKKPKMMAGIVIERKERQYKFDERLVPYYLGGDTKEGNLALREALIKLGKTPEMTELFAAMKTGNIDYHDDAKEVLILALHTIIRGHDQLGLAVIYEEDIKAIHDNNLKAFNEFWDTAAKTDDDDFVGFSN